MKLFNEYRGLRRELYILFIGRIMTGLGSMIWPMFTLILNQKLGLSAATIAACMMVYSVLAIPISLLGGKLADRYSKKRIIIVCDIVSILSFFYCACVPVTISSVVIFSVAGLFQSIEWPSYDSLVADFSTSKDRERAGSLNYFGANLGLVLSPTIGGFLFNHHLNLAFLINGVSIAFSTLMIALFVRNLEREVDDSAASVYEAELDDGQSLWAWLKGQREIMLFLIVSSLSAAVYSMYNYLMPLDLARVHGERGSVLFGTITSVNCIVVVVFTVIITRLFRRQRDTDKLITGEALILCGFLVFVTMIRLPAACYAAIIIFTFGEIFSTLSATPFLTRRTPASHRGRLIAIEGVLCTLVTSACQLVAGLFYDNLSSTAAWGFIFLTGGIVILLQTVIRTFDRKDFPALYLQQSDEEPLQS